MAFLENAEGMRSTTLTTKCDYMVAPCEACGLCRAHLHTRFAITNNNTPEYIGATPHFVAFLENTEGMRSTTLAMLASG